jgi:CO/xanthine dehydrogenase FAD-binding subunit
VISEYFVPKSVSETLQLLEKLKRKAKLVAGGTNVVPYIRAKACRREALIDLSHLKNLSYIREEKKNIRIGALTSVSEIASSKVIQKDSSILAEAAHQIGNPLVRNRATIAGNLADASPAADSAVPLLVLDASVVVEKQKGRPKQIPINEFFIGPNKTVLKRDELIREIIFPKPDPSARMLYSKFGLRNAMAISIVSLGVLAQVEKGRCSNARIALGAVAPTPRRAYGVENLLVGQVITEELIDQCCEAIQEEIQPITDVRATAEYRRSMAAVLLKRLLQQIFSQGHV